MNQDGVRQRLLSYITLKGVKQTFICQYIKIPNSVMSTFLKGKKDLFVESLQKLDEFLKNENY